MKAITSALLSGALLLAMAPAADAAARTSRLTLTIMAQQSGAATSLVLTCDPDGGSHPRPGDACDLLRVNDGDLNPLAAPPNTLCTAMYDPQVAAVSGDWRGRNVFYQRTFTNRCWMTATTGSLFAF